MKVPSYTDQTPVPGRNKPVVTGSRCTTNHGKPGTCKYQAKCDWAIKEVNQGNRPKICKIYGPYAIVCCPDGGGDDGKPAPVTAPVKPTPKPTVANRIPLNTAGRIARKKCQDYAKYVFVEVDSPVLMPTLEQEDQCAASADPLIVGGSQAKPKEFPHMALIGFGEEDNIAWGCGGSLISPRFVLTAAHCLVLDSQQARWVLLGELDRATDRDEAKPELIEIQERIKHPDYKPPAKYHDIALLRLSSTPQMNGFVRPACIHTDSAIRVRNDISDKPVATGWGHTEWAGDSSDHLMKVALRLTDHDSCRRSYANTQKNKLPRGILEDSQMCAGGTVGQDTCQGDSGGPLQVPSGNITKGAGAPYTEPYCMYYIVGVTSFGQACALGAPAVYTRVYHYVSWIEKTVWPNGS